MSILLPFVIEKIYLNNQSEVLKKLAFGRSVEIHPAKKDKDHNKYGLLVQLGERLICIQEVIGSSPI